MKLITFQSPNGEKVYRCRRHRRTVTRDSQGQEHCSVSEGLTEIDARCVVCPPPPGWIPWDDES